MRTCGSPGALKASGRVYQGSNFHLSVFCGRYTENQSLWALGSIRCGSAADTCTEKT